MNYFGVKLFATACFNIYVGAQIHKSFFIEYNKNLEKMMKEQENAIIHAILNKK
jgi:hypothetical protein